MVYICLLIFISKSEVGLSSFILIFIYIYKFHIVISYHNGIVLTKLLCDHSHTDHTYFGCPEPDGLVILLLYCEGCVVCNRATNLHNYE